MAKNFNELIQYGKAFSGLTPELEVCLKDIGAVIIPHLQTVTESFYTQMSSIPNTAFFLDGHIDKLRVAHLNWLTSLFSTGVDASFAEHMYEVGDIHVKVHLPVEFMAGAMTIINNELIRLVFELFPDDPAQCSKALQAINAITGLTLMIMQQSYQESTIANELNKFLRISGMSRALFTNLANA